MAGMVIVGAGECGVRAAFALRELGFDGPVTLLGAEGALPYERPPLSKEPASVPRLIRAEDAYADAGIELRCGTPVAAVESEDRKVRLADGEVLAYDRLLLATGARARRLPGMEGCLSLRTDAEARAIMSTFEPGARIAMIGGGFIGLELAATARRAGAEVTVIEAGPRILGRAVPEAIARIVHARHEAEGVRILTGTGVAGANSTVVSFENGAELAFDAVIAGVGAVPNAELGTKAGLRIDNGIAVDRRFRTSEPDIFAAGDCCSFEWRGTRVRLESWKAAQDQGAHAAAAMLGAPDDYDKVPWFWSDQFDLTLQVAGLFDPAHEVHCRQSTGDTCIVFQCDMNGLVSAAAGIGQRNTIAREVRILEKLIEARTVISPGLLADPEVSIKSLLKAERAPAK